MDLDNLKYSELQKLAKNVGIRANMKVEKLVKALKEHYSNQGQSSDDSKSLKSDVDSSTQPDTTENDQSLANEDKDDTTKRKAPSKGRKKAQKKGSRGKAKKASSSDESHDDKEETVKTQTPQSSTATLKQSTPKVQPQNSAVVTKTPSFKKTPLGTTPKKTPAIIKPVTSKQPKNVTPSVKKAQGSVNQPSSVKTPGTGPKNIPGKKAVTGKSTPGLFSPKGPSSRPVSASGRSMTPKVSTSGRKLASAATKENQKTPGSGSTKRRSPRNSSAEDKQQDEIKGKTAQAKVGGKRKRQDTFELEEPSLASTATPEAEKTMKRAKRSSGTAQQDKTPAGSPGVQDMIDSMAGDISSAERRNRLMSAINKKVEGKVKSSPHAGPTTQIPRFAAFLAKKQQEQKKPITPGNKDWQKVHKKEFAKFDSIDVYLEKKRKRAEEMTASVKKARTVLHEVQEAVTKLKNKRTPSVGKKAQPFKPSVMSTKDMNLNFGAKASSSKTPINRKSTSSAKPFKPTVTSTKDMNLNFSSLKTPVNQKVVTQASSVVKGAQSGRKSVGASQMSAARKSLGASEARKSLSNTPFQFTGNLNVSAVKSATKPVFNLKASLARPITWKPHTGKLKPLEEHYHGKGKGVEHSATKPANTSTRMDVFKSMVNKTQRTYSRHDRRIAAAVKRAEQKTDLQMKRRGINISS
ncbi:uncharacterized protein LOC143296268 [Babylonia areolata]|uniref:uncharacterized protein LOC143296268 n=1 Tax=Babylonia areolata TaxID=304850 RepID=UPI003FD106B2